MPLQLREIEVLPNRILVNNGGLRYEDNLSQKKITLKLVTAYKKASGPDKRIRLVVAERDIMGYPSMALFYHDAPKSASLNFAVPTTVPILQNFMRSTTLADRWMEEVVSGKHSLNEGALDSVSRYNYMILPTAELDILAQCEFTQDKYKEAESFKY